MIAKKHKTPDGRLILAVCDSNLLGQRFEEGGLQLDLTKDFYGGVEVSKEELKKLFKIAYILNVVGEKSVAFALKEKRIEKKSIIRIKNIPHAQCVMFID